MNLFLLVFLLIYGAVHTWFVFRLLQAFPVLQSWWPFPVGWCLLMVAAPVLSRLLEQAGQTFAATMAAYIGYCWMGLLFLFVSLSVLLELLRLLHWSAHFFLQLPTIALLSPRPGFLCCFGLALLISCYGWFEAGHMKVEHLAITTSKLPKGAARVRVVQISDLHIGLIVGSKQVQQLVASVKMLKPDLLVATGDIVDGHISHVDGVSQMLRELQPPLGMVAVMGNHEYYAGFGSSRRFLELSGFQLLQDQTVLVGEHLALVGVDDPAAKRFGAVQTVKETALLQGVANDRFVVLLKHRPVVEQQSIGTFDLQLSGHVHKGQIFPFNLLTWLNFPVRAGMNQLAGGSRLYVSRGTGTWGPPIRFLAPPELTVIDLDPDKK
ncbi:MAG: metallophosphoesterase [Trichlorobacter sp.]|uniref:metallophosphoesterase n=1 Tax=Trichlorobacter sp. TaxID=2911007 RepID=UPI00256ABE73|nr:metallophosphoesterase [Trichlorobacter sp.]MDK9717840.1 metallophosphoesterase [Trichlorobacter sp.]